MNKNTLKAIEHMELIYEECGALIAANWVHAVVLTDIEEEERKILKKSENFKDNCEAHLYRIIEQFKTDRNMWPESRSVCIDVAELRKEVKERKAGYKGKSYRNGTYYSEKQVACIDRLQQEKF